MEQDTRNQLCTNGAGSAVNSIQNGPVRALSDEEFDRYSRQMIVPGMGKEGEICAPCGILATSANVSQGNFD